MNRPLIPTLVCATLVAACSTAAPTTTPTSAALLEKVLAAAGGQQTLADLGVLELKVDEEETTADGTVTTTSTHAYASGGRLEHLRMEAQGGLILVRSGVGGWATVNGQLDQRPQTPKMASGTVAQRLFPVLLPFSLAMDGVTLGEPVETSFEGAPAWRLEVSLAKGFFVNPVMSTTWHLYVSRPDGSFLAAEFQPAPDMAKVATEGMRYRVIKSQTVGGCRLPAQLLLDGVDGNGSLTGHTRVVKVTTAIRGPWDPTLFLSPDKLKAIEGED